MTEEKFGFLDNLVTKLNKEAGTDLVLDKQFNSVGVCRASNKEDWSNLEGYNLLGQLRIIMDLTKDIT